MADHIPSDPPAIAMGSSQGREQSAAFLRALVTSHTRKVMPGLVWFFSRLVLVCPVVWFLSYLVLVSCFVLVPSVSGSGFRPLGLFVHVNFHC